MKELYRYTFLVGFLFSIIFVSGCGRIDPITEADSVRQIEQQRVRALVEADIAVAHVLHADDFQLITPDGSEYTKQTYLKQIESGELDYRVWKPGKITVRLYQGVAVIRYDDTEFKVLVNGKLARSGLLRHTNLYEKRKGQWQIVWSHASGGQSY